MTNFNREIVKKIDKDSDGKITEKEMKDWISYVALSSAQQVTEKHWAEVNPKGHTLLSWEEYAENSYGPHEGKSFIDEVILGQNFRLILCTRLTCSYWAVFRW